MYSVICDYRYIKIVYRSIVRSRIDIVLKSFMLHDENFYNCEITITIEIETATFFLVASNERSLRYESGPRRFILNETRRRAISVLRGQLNEKGRPFFFLIFTREAYRLHPVEKAAGPFYAGCYIQREETVLSSSDTNCLGL